MFSYSVHLSLGFVSCLFSKNPFTNTWEIARDVNLTKDYSYSAVHVLVITTAHAGAVHAQNRCYLCRSTLSLAAGEHLLTERKHSLPTHFVVAPGRTNTPSQ
jgi:hypothetical protein